MKKSIICLLLLFLAPNFSFSWSEKGHSLVAEIAFKYLDKKTKKIVLKYLDGMTIQEAANWMDDIKKDKTYDYLKPMHYVNFEKDQVVKDNCCDNIISALNQAITDIKNHKNFSNAEVKIRICYLFHLIGDLHQPLHIGYGADKGGNTFQVNFNGKGTNLHSLFDSGIINYTNLNLKNCLKEKKYNASEIAEIQVVDVVNWSVNSRSYLDQIYSVKNNKIDEEYVQTNVLLIKSQLHLAGIRLAGILKNSFN